jgi:hypothetical protein
MQPTPPAPPGPSTWPRQFWRGIKGTVVFLIVVFHLVVLAIRNPLDLWYPSIRGWITAHAGASRAPEYLRLANRFTWKYTNLVGCEQSWDMFSPPVARKADFLAIRFEFTDGSSERVLSSGEPDPTSFFRVGGWQWRKLEDYLLYPSGRLTTDSERLLWEACARHAARTWQARHPDDPRTLAKIVFIRRQIPFPEPGTDPRQYDPPEETPIVEFDGQGRLLP